jgi:hypothetical protein
MEHDRFALLERLLIGAVGIALALGATGFLWWVFTVAAS